MKRVIIFTWIALIIGGCSNYSRHAEPEDNRDFDYIHDLKELEGVYNNNGEPSGHLSFLIWGYTSRIKHQQVDYIEVIVNGKILTAKAIENDCYTLLKHYIEDKDISIDNGRILVESESTVLGDGGFIVGPSGKSVEIGIDEDGHGKYKYSSFSAGMGYWVVPVTSSIVDEVRYEKIYKHPVGYPECKTANKPLNSTPESSAN